MPFSNLQLFVACVLIWGTTWLAITYQLGEVAQEVSVGYRFLLSSFILFAFCRIRKLPLRFTPREHVDLALFGIAMFSISYIAVYYAETYIVSGMVAIAYSASPMINMVAARIFFGTVMTMRVAVAASFGIAGIACVFWPEFSKVAVSRNATLGAAFAVVSVLLSSVGSMVATRTQRLGYSTWTSMAWGMFYGGVTALVIGVVSGKSLIFTPTIPYLLVLVYLALFGSVITFACYLTLMSRIGAARVAYVGVMTPIVALVVSFFFEKFSWGLLTTIGVVLSMVGNAIMLRTARTAE